mmetsp:Transcript_19917/g.55960  ORF Transcript_19917/g.55960 Transcript_19917/m.55960 type:complete len:338 (-) Transcript_19917:2-1015(-)
MRVCSFYLHGNLPLSNSLSLSLSLSLHLFLSVWGEMGRLTEVRIEVSQHTLAGSAVCQKVLFHATDRNVLFVGCTRGRVSIFDTRVGGAVGGVKAVGLRQGWERHDGVEGESPGRVERVKDRGKQEGKWEGKGKKERDREEPHVRIKYMSCGGGVNALALSNSPYTLFSGDMGGTVSLWDLRKQERWKSFVPSDTRGVAGAVADIQLQSSRVDAPLLAVNTYYQGLQLFDERTILEERDLQGVQPQFWCSGHSVSPMPIRCAISGGFISGDTCLAASGSTDGNIALYFLSGQDKEPRTLLQPGRSNRLYGITMPRQGRDRLTSFGDKGVFVWDIGKL